MFITGITKVEDLRNPKKLQTAFLKRKRTISIGLYSSVYQEEDGDILASLILERFKDDRRAYKRTYTNRFDDFDEVCVYEVGTCYGNKGTIRVHDIGVSDGRSTVHLYKSLRRLYEGLYYTASDYFGYLRLLERGGVKLYLNERDEIMEIDYGPFVFRSGMKKDYIYPISCVIYIVLRRVIGPYLIKRHRVEGEELEKVGLFAWDVLRMAEREERFILTEHNIIDEYGSLQDVIRAMNLLNVSYFTRDEFRRIIMNIYKGLEEGGLFIVGSNEGAGTVVNGGIYKREEGCFRLVRPSGAGAAIHDLIMDRSFWQR